MLNKNTYMERYVTGPADGAEANKNPLWRNIVTLNYLNLKVNMNVTFKKKCSTYNAPTKLTIK